MVKIQSVRKYILLKHYTCESWCGHINIKIKLPELSNCCGQNNAPPHNIHTHTHTHTHRMS